MSQQTVTKCDVCGKIKGESNNWITAVDGGNCITFGELYNPNIDICSKECLNIKLAPYIERKPEPKP